MAHDTPRAYLDTSVYISVFTRGENDPDGHLPRSEVTISRCDAGELALVASTLVLAEIMGAPNMRGSHVPKQSRHKALAKARTFFEERTTLITWVDVDRRVATRAGELAIEHQLCGGDAVHLASALRAGCEYLYTWDRDLLKIGTVDGLTVAQPDFGDQLPFGT